MKDGPKEIWSQIVKYSIIANGTALTLSIAAMGKTPIFELKSSFGKFPIWCFFFGLLAGGLHLVFSFLYQIEEQKIGFITKYADFDEKLQEAKTQVFRLGITDDKIIKNFDLGAEIQKNLHELKTVSGPLDTTILSVYRNAQEWLLWLAHILFFIGLFSVVYAV